MKKKSRKKSNNAKKPVKGVDEFNVLTINMMIDLYKNEALSEEIIGYIQKLNMWYYSMIEKIDLLEENANVDQKTGLLKYNDNYLEKLVNVAGRAYEKIDKGVYQLGLFRLDIDDFSIFNNKYGHDVGDEVLKKIGVKIRKSTRPTDYCIRFGGE